MKVLVVGGDGRAHAIAWKLRQSPLLKELYCFPGNAGTADIATNIVLASDAPDVIANWARENGIDFTVVSPESFLAAGIVNSFEAMGLKIFGPTKEAAQLESSKSFAKEVMFAAGVPTAKSKTFTDYDSARKYVQEQGAPIVIKADGLAAGKGVVVATTLEQALTALEDCMLDSKLGSAGAIVVVEQFIEGREASAIAIIDGETVKPFVLSQDYKRQLDNDQGPNTGGMGAISPTEVFPESRMQELVELVFLPTIRELASRGIRFRGFLYAGIMVSKADGKPYVLEFNCRLGDPETQVLLPRLKSDLLQVLISAVDGKLSDVELSFDKRAAATVVMASAGYPVAVDDRKEIKGLFTQDDQTIVFHAGTYRDGEIIRSKGGRILTVTALGDTLSQALERAYRGVSRIAFDGAQYRKDIGGGIK